MNGAALLAVAQMIISVLDALVFPVASLHATVPCSVIEDVAGLAGTSRFGTGQKKD